MQLQYIINEIQGKKEIIESCGVYFGQNAEDTIILQLLKDDALKKGMYVDFGAYHPVKYSMTYLLYLCGWRGVNVDANQQTIESFDHYRSDDINIRALVSNEIKKERYVSFKEGAYNTSNDSSITELLNREGAEFTKTNDETIESTTPDIIFNKYVKQNKFDFLNIDLEGFDEKVLYSINFDRYRPKVISVETRIENWTNEPMKSFLTLNNYKVVSHCNETAIFLRQT